MKILCVYPDMMDATSWYRGAGVMGSLHKQGDVDCIATQAVHWTVLKGIDVLFMQRPFLDVHIECIKIAKNLNIPVWIDYDDLVTDIPKGNPFLKAIKHQYNMTKDHLNKNIIKCLNLSDAVTVSTNALREAFREYSNHIVVVHNAHDDYMFPAERRYQGDPDNVILWRGSQSHKNDLIDYEREIRTLISKHKDHRFYFMGYNPKIITNRHSNATYIEPTDVYHYFMKLKELRPKVIITPLKDNPFNRAKSNIAALEASYFGAVCISPEFPEWKSVSTTCKKSDFTEMASLLIEDEEKRKLCRESCWGEIAEMHLLSAENYRRYEMLTKMKGGINV